MVSMTVPPSLQHFRRRGCGWAISRSARSTGRWVGGKVLQGAAWMHQPWFSLGPLPVVRCTDWGVTWNTLPESSLCIWQADGECLTSGSQPQAHSGASRHPLLQVPFRHRSNPVFDETLEVIVDGATAQQRDLQVVVEIWMLHMLRKPTFRVRAAASSWLPAVQSKGFPGRLLLRLPGAQLTPALPPTAPLHPCRAACAFRCRKSLSASGGGTHGHWQTWRRAR